MPSRDAAMPLGFSKDPTRSRALPGHYYFDPGIFELERRKVFFHTWQYVGHSSMLPDAGSYLVREILDQSVLLLRDRQGEIRAYFNVCQHRALQQLMGAMLADVEVGANFSLPIAQKQDALVENLADQVAPGIRQHRTMPNILPGVKKYLASFELEDSRIEIIVTRQGARACWILAEPERHCRVSGWHDRSTLRQLLTATKS